MNKKTYTKLIEENIVEIEKYMPEHSLEKKHIVAVLRWSVGALYEGKGLLVDQRVPRDRKRQMRKQATNIFELTKGFTGEPTDNAMKAALEMAGYVQELTIDVE